MDEKKSLYEIINIFWSFLKKWMAEEKTDAVWSDMIHEASDIAKEANATRNEAEARLVADVMVALVNYFGRKEQMKNGT